MILENNEHAVKLISLQNKKSEVPSSDYLTDTAFNIIRQTYLTVNNMSNFFRYHELYGERLIRKEESSVEAIRIIFRKFIDYQTAIDKTIAIVAQNPFSEHKKYLNHSPSEITQFYDEYWESFEYLLRRFRHLLFNKLTIIFTSLDIIQSYYKNITDSNFDRMVNSINSTMQHICALMEIFSSCQTLEILFDTVLEEDSRLVTREH